MGPIPDFEKVLSFERDHVSSYWSCPSDYAGFAKDRHNEESMSRNCITRGLRPLVRSGASCFNQYI